MNFFKHSLLSLLFFPAIIFAGQGNEEKMDFAHDVLQHHGAPIVSFYHKLRENFFLHTEIEGAPLLEACGDFFLSPGRYLFGGKTLHFDQKTGEWKVEQSFHYEKGFSWKAPLAIFLLPFTEPVGALLKTCAYFISDRKEMYSAIQKKVLSIPTQLKERDLSSFYSEVKLKHQNYPRPDQLSERQYTDLLALEQIISLFKQNNIVCWLDFGTSLGAYRHGGMIPWDYDIDIAIFNTDHQAAKRVLSMLDPAFYEIQDWSSYKKPETFLRLYVKPTRNFIDIYHYEIDPQTKMVQYLFSFEQSPFPERWKRSERFAAAHPLHYDEMFPLQKAEFDHLEVWVPKNMEAYLHGRYGANLEPSMIWDQANGLYKKVEGHPYWKFRE